MKSDDQRAHDARQWFRETYGIDFDTMPADWRIEYLAARAPERLDRWCGKCRHFQSRPTGSHGECRARMPKVNLRSPFPIVARSQWCAGFKLKTETEGQG